MMLVTVYTYNPLITVYEKENDDVSHCIAL